MAAISTILAATAATAAIAGTGMSIYGAQGAAKTQGAAANNQYIANQFQMAGTDVQAQAAALQNKQQTLAIDTQKQAIQYQQQSDDLRRVAANLDASRRSREEVRKGISARAQATSAAINQGAGDVGSSALGGASGTISGRVGTNLMGIFQNQQIGNKLFDVNKQISQNYLNAQDTNKGYVQQSLGYQSELLGLQKAIYSAGGQTSLSYKDAAAYGSISAFGSGLTSLGGAVVKNEENLTNLSKYFSNSFGSSDLSVNPWSQGGLLGQGSSSYSAYQPSAAESKF